MAKIQRDEKNRQRILYTPLVDTVVCCPGAPFMTARLILLLWGVFMADGSQLYLFPGIAFGQVGCLAQVTIQHIIYGPMCTGDSLHLKTDWWRNIRSPPSCLILGQFWNALAPSGIAPATVGFTIQVLHLLSHTSQTFLQVPFLIARPNKPHTNLHFRVYFKGTWFKIQSCEKKMEIWRTWTINYEKINY